MTHSRQFQLQSVALSDLGLKRRNNEDSILCLPNFRVFAVADGMGGAEAGEVASERAVRSIENALRSTEDAEYGTISQTSRLVTKALKDASNWIWRYAREHNLRSCGTTVVTLIFDSRVTERAIVLHAGDSRAYRFRNGLLEQITRDHSFAEASGVTDVRQLPARLQGVITRAVGIAQSVGVEETPVTVADGDVFLLCSDGLSSMVANFRIQEILRQNEKADLDKTARMLIAEANRCGGNDNVSVVLVRVVPLPTEVFDSPTSTGVDTPSHGGPPARTVTVPQDIGARTTSPKAGQGFEPRPDTLNVGFSTVVRLGLGVIAILLLVLVLLTVADRRRAYLEASRRSARVAVPGRAGPGEGQPSDVRIPVVFDEDVPQVDKEPAPGDVDGDVVAIPPDSETTSDADAPAPAEMPPVYEPGSDTNSLSIE